MPNHYTNLITMYPNLDEPWRPDLVAQLRDREWQRRLFNRVRPVDALRQHNRRANLIDLHRQHWGTRCDPYDFQAHELPGDLAPVMLGFETAWSPPNEPTRRAVLSELRERFAVDPQLWIGMDPGTRTSEVLWQED